MEQQGLKKTQVTAAPGSRLNRFIAAIIDSIIISILSLPVTMISNQVTNQSDLIAIPHNFETMLPMILIISITFALGLLIGLLYYGYYYTKSGQTIGKRVMGLQVVNADSGELLTWNEVILRESLGKTVSIILLIGYFMILLRQDRRALHDLIGNSIVIDK